MRRGAVRLLLVPLAAALVSLAVAAPAGAAGFLNGDFETGTLEGWHVHRLTSGGNWFAYEGTSTPISVKRGRLPVPPPPQGSHAAVSDEVTADTVILYQDVTLPPGSREELSLLAYYDSYKPIAVPTPDTLSVEEEALGGQANQQFRIDLVRPEAPLESLAPGDVLATLLATQPGDPQHLGPTRLSADLAPFAGQTVRLRIAVAAHEELFNAGVDAVALSGAGPGSAAAGHFRVGKPRANPKNGTVVLPVIVPGPGRVRASARGKGMTRPVSAKAAAAGALKLRLQTGSRGRRLLRRKHRLRVVVAASYRRAGGGGETASVPVTFRLR